MSKKYLWRVQTVIIAAILSIGFSSCCEDKTVVIPADGLEGYWLQDLYKLKPEATDEDTPESDTGESEVFDDSNPSELFYLDGHGGGTYYHTVCTEERWNSDEKYQEKFTLKLGEFKDFKENTHTYYGYKVEALVYTKIGSTIAIILSDSNNSLNDIIGDTNIGDVIGDGNGTINDIIGNVGNTNIPINGIGTTTSSFILKNVDSEGISGFHKASKIESQNPES